MIAGHKIAKLENIIAIGEFGDQYGGVILIALGNGVGVVDEYLETASDLLVQ
jgi:hypothetical protein